MPQENNLSQGAALWGIRSQLQFIQFFAHLFSGKSTKTAATRAALFCIVAYFHLQKVARMQADPLEGDSAGTLPLLISHPGRLARSNVYDIFKCSSTYIMPSTVNSSARKGCILYKKYRFTFCAAVYTIFSEAKNSWQCDKLHIRFQVLVKSGCFVEDIAQTVGIYWIMLYVTWWLWYLVKCLQDSGVCIACQ